MRRRRHGLDEGYLEFIDYFNRSLFEESHLALFPSWQRNRTNDFYKGLIQIAGAFQHCDSGSLFWAEDMFATAHNLLAPYAPRHMGLDVDKLLGDLQACNEAARRARTDTSASVEVPRIHLSVDFSQD